jgi:hypothetical protein
MMNYNEINYNNNICNNEHFVQRAAESPRRETLRGRNDVSLLVNDIIAGVYSYRQISGKMILNTGKLIITN